MKGMLQNLVVEPEQDASGERTGSYFVTIGEGRRLAQLLRAKRKQIKKAEPIRCVLDTENDPQEISLDENVTREAMHPGRPVRALPRACRAEGLGRGGNRRPLRCDPRMWCGSGCASARCRPG